MNRVIFSSFSDRNFSDYFYDRFTRLQGRRARDGALSFCWFRIWQMEGLSSWTAKQRANWHISKCNSANRPKWQHYGRIGKHNGVPNEQWGKGGGSSAGYEWGACRGFPEISQNFRAIFAKNLRHLDAELAHDLALERTTTRKIAALKFFGSRNHAGRVHATFVRAARWNFSENFTNFSSESQKFSKNFWKFFENFENFSEVLKKMKSRVWK